MTTVTFSLKKRRIYQGMPLMQGIVGKSKHHRLACKAERFAKRWPSEHSSQVDSTGFLKVPIEHRSSETGVRK